mgnify:CR=1 FL=1
MKLKFIGQDDSMRLKHGEIYDCTIDTRWGSVWVTWSHRTNWQTGSCPYSSLKLLLENWCEVEG